MTAAKEIKLTFVSDEMRDKFEKEYNKLISDKALMEKIDAVDSIEEIYEVCKDRVEFSLDQYREVMKEVEAHIKSQFMDNQDEELTDDDLEDVVGGFSWGNFWKNVGKAAAIIGVAAAVVAIGVVTGGAAAAGVAALGTAFAGTLGTAAGTSAIIVGATAGGVAGGAIAIKAMVTD